MNVINTLFTQKNSFSPNIDPTHFKNLPRELLCEILKNNSPEENAKMLYNNIEGVREALAECNEIKTDLYVKTDRNIFNRIIKSNVQNYIDEYKADHSDLNIQDAYLYLNGVDLSHMDLNGVDLSGAKLVGTNFSGADLSRANLSHANLKGANLQGADTTNTVFPDDY